MESPKKNGGNKEISNREQFSPLSKSLATKPVQGKNLTGSARHVRDLAADIHNSVQQWNTVHLQGLSLLKLITTEKQDESYSQSLQVLCDQLEDVCDSLDAIVRNLEQIAHQMKVIATLDKNADKLFITWPVTKFGHVAELIHDSYHQEAVIKRKVLENVAHGYSEAWKMVCLASWVHQPLLPNNAAVLLESLLLETGHRSF